MVTLLRRIGPPAFVAVIAFAATRSAMLPGLEYWDTGELQAVGPLMGTAHPPGFPTYVLLGWLASVVLQPFGEPAFRMNLLAGLCVAAAAGLTVDLVRALTRSALLGIGAGLGLALTPVAWSIGTHAETHALHLLLLVVLVRLLVAWEARVRRSIEGSADRYLIAAAIVYGLSIGNHGLTFLLAPAVGLFVLAVDRQIWRNTRLIQVCAGALLLAVTIVYLELPLRSGPFRAALVYGRPETWDGFWYVALGEQFRGSLVDPFGDLAGKLAALGDRTVTQFGPLAPLLPLGFAFTVVRQPRYALLTGAAVLITVFFAASYQNADIGRYYLGPAVLAWTWLAILGAVAAELGGQVLARLGGRSRRSGRVTTLVAGIVLAVLVSPSLLSVQDRFASIDQRHNRSAADWVDRALGAMEPDAVIVSWWSYSTPLWYAQRVEGRRPDIVIIDDRTRLDERLGDFTDVIDANLGRRPVYVIRSDAAEVALLAERYRLEPIDGPDAWSLTKVVERRGEGS